ncbi:MAG: hypothetical protein V4850_17770 [Myxococcota bacterium]
MATLRQGNRPVTAATVTTTRPWAEPLWLDPGGDPPLGVRLNRRPVEGGRGRIPWLRGDLEWSDRAGAHRVRIELPERLRPDDHPELPPAKRTEPRREALRAFGDMLAERCGKGTVTVGQVRSLPLLAIAGLADAVRVTPLDTLQASRLGTLSDLCTRPRSWLREETAVLPVGRVRRPARDAVTHLQRHTEHAGHDGLRVYPERILASLQEEELDLYENRVLVTLLSRLQERARKRFARVELALSGLYELLADLDAAKACGQHRRAGRLRKWLDAEGDLATHRANGEDSQSALRTQLRSLGACLTSPLALTLRDRPQVRAPLRETNILTFDGKFRVVLELWEALEIEEREHRRPLDAVREDPDGVWADYAYLLLLRALLDAGFKPAGDPTLALTLQPVGPADLVFERPAPSGSWRATVSRRLARGNDMLELSIERTRPAAAAAARSRGPVVTLPKAPPVTVRFAPTFAQGDRPVDPDVVWLHPQIPSSDDEALPSAALPYPAVVARSSAGLSHDGLRRVPRAIPIAPWSAASGDRLLRLVRALTVGVSLTNGEPVEWCPACGAAGRVGSRPNDRVCSDPDCGAEWGWRRCPDPCGAHIPKLLPHLPNADALEKLVFRAEGAPKRLVLQERIAGPDLLADWCLEGIGTHNMICPACGRCANPSPVPGCVRCVRGGATR